MATSISIPGGNNAPPLVFTVTGTSTTNYAKAFASVLQNASNNGSLTINVLSTAAPAHVQAPDNVVLNEIFSQSVLDSYTLDAGGQYTIVSVGSSTTVNGSAAGGDTVVAGAAVTYNAAGGNDNVDFIAGDNVFFGNDLSGDTITGGAGHDSIFTGAGSSLVFSGAGNTLIDLNDAGANSDTVYLGDGHATVNATGVSDTVVAGSNGQAIFGGSGNLLINILDHETSSGAASDTITAGSGTTTVFDSVGGSAIFGGSGALTFVGGASTNFQADTIVAGSGATAIFGASGNNLVFSTTTSNDNLTVVAGQGNETLNGGTAQNFSLFGSTTDTTGSLVAYGGTGNDYFVIGDGSESIHAGSGSDTFGLFTTLAGHGDITIFGWTAADSVSTDASNQTNVEDGKVVNGNYTVTLSDETTVTFMGVTSLSGHII